MSHCRCEPALRADVSFDNGVVLLRCPRHESRCWLLHGEPVSAEVALPRLRELFLQQRTHQTGRPAHQRAARDQVIRLSEPARAPAAAPASAAASDARVDDASLNALLQARGLTGTWAIA